MRVKRCEGFTLVELMVVIVIIGLAASLVVLNLPRGGASLSREAERFAARALAARDTAILDSSPHALLIEPSGYRIIARGEGGWRPRAAHSWEEGVSVTAQGAAGPRSRFDPDGLADPLRVTLARDGEQIAIDIAAGGEIRVLR